MTSFSAMLKTEITRLSRKEIRLQVEPLRRASATYRRDIAALKRQVAMLERQVAAGKHAVSVTAQPDKDATSTRFVAKGLRSLRARLGLSAADFGILAGASAQSIYNWESGKAVPRKQQTTVLAGLRTLGKREAQARLLDSANKASKGAKRGTKA